MWYLRQLDSERGQGQDCGSRSFWTPGRACQSNNMPWTATLSTTAVRSTTAVMRCGRRPIRCSLVPRRALRKVYDARAEGRALLPSCRDAAKRVSGAPCDRQGIARRSSCGVRPRSDVS